MCKRDREKERETNTIVFIHVLHVCVCTQHVLEWMNTRLNFLYFISNIHYSLSPGYGFWFFFPSGRRNGNIRHHLHMVVWHSPLIIFWVCFLYFFDSILITSDQHFCILILFFSAFLYFFDSILITSD